jgi:hypothetical protein
MTEMDKKRLGGTWDRKTLRTFGPMREQGIWRISNNQELRDVYRDLHIVAGLKKREREREWNGLDI